MLILLDNGTPRGITRSLSGHTVKETRVEGWDALSNGELLTAAEAAGFEVLVTTTKTSVTNRTSQAEGLRLWYWAKAAGALSDQCWHK